MAVTWVEAHELFPTAVANLKPANIILDIGCGIMPQKLITPAVHICCEPFGQYVEHLLDKTKDYNDRHYIIIQATWAEAVKLFPPRSVDTVFLMDVVEHLEKNEALGLLKATEKLARKQVNVFTPLGFMPQNHSDGKDAWGLNGGPWQEHKSGWYSNDFDDSWKLLVAKDFHMIDNMGKPFESPYGAIWAIREQQLYGS